MRSVRERLLIELKKWIALSLGKATVSYKGNQKSTEPRKEKFSRRVCSAVSTAVKATHPRRTEELGSTV